ncbi:MAG TPA: MBL fold metallo-hydrolase, partial [Verrucomicrobiae bacterium]|nr:MBL fold metallo-hydrolase [Verrucomicrobiae bacterium]
MTDGVYAALQPAELRFDDCNSAIVILDDGVLVVDSQTSPLGARAVLAEIRKLTTKPVRWLVNTHWHSDHVLGNQVYQEAFPQVMILAHRNTHRDFFKRTVPALKEDREGMAAWLERARKALETGEADGQKLTDQQKEAVRGRIERRSAYLKKLEAVTDFAPPNLTFDRRYLVAGGRAEVL